MAFEDQPVGHIGGSFFRLIVRCTLRVSSGLYWVVGGWLVGGQLLDKGGGNVAVYPPPLNAPTPLEHWSKSDIA